MLSSVHNVQEVPEVYISKDDNAIYIKGKKVCSSAEDYNLITETLAIFSKNLPFCNSSEPEVQLSLSVNLKSLNENNIENDITNRIFLTFKIVQNQGIKFLCIDYLCYNFSDFTNDSKESWDSPLHISRIPLNIFISRLEKYNSIKYFPVFKNINIDFEDNYFLHRIGELIT